MFVPFYRTLAGLCNPGHTAIESTVKVLDSADDLAILSAGVFASHLGQYMSVLRIQVVLHQPREADTSGDLSFIILKTTSTDYSNSDLDSVEDYRPNGQMRIFTLPSRRG